MYSFSLYRYYIDIIYFLQCQYAGSTSISGLEKVTTLAAKLKIDRQNIDEEVQKTKKCQEDIKYEQQYLSARLEIVERLKDMLEQQIGAGNVQNIMEHYAEISQQTLSVSFFVGIFHLRFTTLLKSFHLYCLVNIIYERIMFTSIATPMKRTLCHKV